MKIQRNSFVFLQTRQPTAELGARLDSAALYHFTVRREFCSSEIRLSVDLALNLMSQLGFDVPSPQGAVGQGVYKPLPRVTPNKHAKGDSSFYFFLSKSIMVKRFILEIQSPYLKVEDDIFRNPIVSEES